MNVRGTTLFGVGATLYALSRVVDGMFENVLNIPIPISSVMVGLLFGFLPLWASASIYLFDVGASALDLYVELPRLQALLINTLQLAIDIGSEAPTIEGPGIHPVAIYLSFVILIVLAVWKYRATLDILKGAAIAMGVTILYMVGPIAYFFVSHPHIPTPSIDDPSSFVTFSNIAVVFASIMLIWMVVVSPFIAYAFFQRIGLFRRVRAVALH